nr:hypothetical protein [uncultured Cohaesibacter sp.]
MKRNFLFAGARAIFAYTILAFPLSVSAWAACLENGADQTLYILLKSKSGQIERNLPVGDVICLNVSENTEVKANIQPFGGARFGCRFEFYGKESYLITHFQTIDNCKFKDIGK